MSNEDNNHPPQPSAQVQSTPPHELPREPTNRIVKGNLSDDRIDTKITGNIKKAM